MKKPVRSNYAALHRQLSTTGAAHQYAQAAQRQSVFAPYPSIEDMMRALESKTEPVELRERLTRALIAEAQSDRQGPWMAVLLLAYEPMLHLLCVRLCLRLRLRPRGSERDEIEQLVSAAFIEVILSYPLERWAHHSIVRLRQQTTRMVVRQLKEEHAYQRDRLQLARINRRDPEFSLFAGAPYAVAPDERAGLEATLAKHASDFPKEHLELLRETSLAGVRLSEYVRQSHASRPAEEQRRAYEALKRRRSRLTCELRSRLDAAIAAELEERPSLPFEDHCAL
jgi:hypothetical protein